jgi:hypothetical protein
MPDRDFGVAAIDHAAWTTLMQRSSAPVRNSERRYSASIAIPSAAPSSADPATASIVISIHEARDVQADRIFLWNDKDAVNEPWNSYGCCGDPPVHRPALGRNAGWQATPIANRERSVAKRACL